MTPTQLVRALKLVAHESGVKGVLASLEKPPGRTPNAELLKLSDWYRKLPLGDKQATAMVADMAAKQAVYNVLLAFDGLLAIEPPGEKGELELSYRRGSEIHRLNPPDAQSLSEIFSNTT